MKLNNYSDTPWYFRKYPYRILLGILICGIIICTVMAISLCFVSCSDMHDPVLHASGKVEVHPEIEQKVNIDMMWDVDWDTQWQVDWDTETKGEIGYTEPETYHINYFRAGGSREPLGERDMASGSIRVDLGYGDYDLLFYNNDYQYIRIDEAPDWSYAIARTEKNTYAELPDSLNGKLEVRQMPEQLFSMFSTDVKVSDRLEDYEYIPEENIYLLRLNSELLPRVFIYLLQVDLKNNNGRVDGCGSTTINGLAPSVDLLTTVNGSEAIAHQFGSFYQEKEQADGEKLCLIGGRLTTFGLPGISPWEEHNKDAASRSASRADVRNTCYLMLRYSNGGYRCIAIDITGQMKTQPVGGIINITLDVDKYEEPKPGTGGFNPGVGEWEEEDNHHTDV